jgi:hypothetical protein
MATTLKKVIQSAPRMRGSLPKKAQTGIVADKTSVIKTKPKGVVRNQPTYNRLKSNATKKDSTEYKKGYDFAVESPKNSELYRGLSSNKAWNAGNEEGSSDKRPKKKLKTGGTVAKDGKWMQKAAASIKKRGTAGKCTPITKPGCTGKAKALAKTFKAIAKKNKK